MILNLVNKDKRNIFFHRFLIVNNIVFINLKQTYYLMWRPHLALPLAASLIVIPLEQELNAIAKTIANKSSVDFFIVEWFLD
jgi:hypothetical protein